MMNQDILFRAVIFSLTEHWSHRGKRKWWILMSSSPPQRFWGNWPVGCLASIESLKALHVDSNVQFNLSTTDRKGPVVFLPVSIRVFKDGILKTNDFGSVQELSAKYNLHWKQVGGNSIPPAAVRVAVAVLSFTMTELFHLYLISLVYKKHTF